MRSEQAHNEDDDHFDRRPGHRGHAHTHPRNGRTRPLLIALIITAAFAVIELLGGLISGSLALLSDSGHMFTDLLALMLSLGAAMVAQREATATKTFGYLRVEILAALANGVALIVVGLFISFEAVQRAQHPVSIDSELMLYVAFAGLAANIAGAYVLHDASGESLNIRGAFLHMLGDMLSSVGVIVAAILIMLFGWTIADPVISAAISLVILYGAVRLTLQSAYVLLEFTPAHIDLHEVRDALKNVPGVEEVHDIHAWTISSGIYALSAHIRVNDQPISACSCIVKACEHVLQERFEVSHTTLQLEYAECDMEACFFKGFPKKE